MMVSLPKNSNIHNLHHSVPSFQALTKHWHYQGLQTGMYTQPTFFSSLCDKAENQVTRQSVTWYKLDQMDKKPHFLRKKKKTTRIIREKVNISRKDLVIYSVLCLLTLKAAGRGTTQWHRYKMVNDPESSPLERSVVYIIVWGKFLSFYINWRHSFIQHIYIF